MGTSGKVGNFEFDVRTEGFWFFVKYGNVGRYKSDGGTCDWGAIDGANDEIEVRDPDVLRQLGHPHGYD